MKYGIHPVSSAIPALFSRLGLSPAELYCTADGFLASRRSLAEILTGRGIETFPDYEGRERRCDLFYDDWYLYCIPDGEDICCSLFKMREQEFNAQRGEIADGDTPGVTVCFVAFDTNVLLRCLEDPTQGNRDLMNHEINRTVASLRQRHHPALKDYFRRPQAQAPYLIAEMYVHFIAGLHPDGILPVPVGYAEIYRKKPNSRLPRFLEENNAQAGRTVCDQQTIFLENAAEPSRFEALAILATHTADTGFHSFAAEVCYHACYLFPLARIPIPFLGRSVYDSAIRADLTIAESELEGPAPFHNPRSRWVRRQRRLHD